MENSFKEAKSMNQFRDFMQQNTYLIDDQNTAFILNLVNDWDEGLLSQKLIELNEEELAQQIDAINPNQSRYEICKEIYAIILNDTSKSISQTHSDSDNSNEFSWLDYYLTYDIYL